MKFKTATDFRKAWKQEFKELLPKQVKICKA